MTEQEKDNLRCDVLLLIALSEEEKQLKLAARALGLQFERNKVQGLGEYFRLGMVGSNRVNVVRTDLGPFGYQGSASRAIHFRAATGTAGIIQLGMAFGVDPSTQKIGDVLVSTSLIPYDLREVRPTGVEGVVLPTGAVTGGEAIGAVEEDTDSVSTAAGQAGGAHPAQEPAPPLSVPTPPTTAEVLPYVVDYRHATRRPARPALVRLFLAERERAALTHAVHVGGVLSGGARIFSRAFLRELVRGVSPAEDGILGGEMEGVGLLAASPDDDPVWVVVKGISDVADEDRDRIIKQTRPVACENAARFVLSALANARPG